jgi:alpha-galactosidase
MLKVAPFLAILCLATPLAAWSFEDKDIPTDAPQDAVMAGPEEIRQLVAWSHKAFAGRRPPGQEAIVGVELVRQDHSALRFGQSCMETPIKIGDREFKRGLGTHGTSEIVLHLPPNAKSFMASVGIDNNFSTQGRNGSVKFSVEAGGKELFHTPTLRGGNPPATVNVDLPKDARQIVLKVDSTPDGPGFDQADWADARVILEDGTTLWADEDRQAFLAAAIPFSFVYDGAASSELLKNWTRTADTADENNRLLHKVQWTDPKTGLRVSVLATVFKRYGAVEWLLQFENTGASDTPAIENIQALDAVLNTGYYAKPVVLHQLLGDVCDSRSFTPTEATLELGKPKISSPDGGRPSNGAFPFFNLQYGNEGLIAAIGWSGQWLARFDRSDRGPTRVSAGMEKTHLKLHPGESIRGPRILAMPWNGDRTAAHNRFRRLMLFEYAPKIAGHPLRLPVALQCFDRYSGSQPDWGTEAGQLRAARASRDIGCDTHWIDAAWFEGGFPDGVGNWYCKPQGFPNGLKPISDLCHSMGLKLIVWFEPERVAPKTAIAREHPEFVLGGQNGGLFKLNDPAARRWMTDLLSTRIRENGIDIYRNDFNIDPLSFWRANDTPDRQGMTEIRYVEGHYAMWDELRARHPGLWIDNCASGGRRIDLETISRSVPLWRSDTCCAPSRADWDQSQVYGLSQYVPLFTGCSWDTDPYTLRSGASAGAICQFNFLDGSFSTNAAQAALAEIKENQKFWYGDFYPLTPQATGPQGLIAYQLHRADLNEGIVLAFRRENCPYPSVQVSLGGLNPEARYAVESFDESRQMTRTTISGKEMNSDWEIRMPKKKQSLLIRYKPCE